MKRLLFALAMLALCGTAYANKWLWTDANNPSTYPLYEVTHCPGLNLYVAVGGTYFSSPGCILTSPDGSNWTKQTQSPDYFLQGVCYSPELNTICAVGAGTIVEGFFKYSVWTSSDGNNWTSQDIVYESTSGFGGCVWSSGLGKFAIGGLNSGRIHISSDGNSWVAYYSGSIHQIDGIAWSPGLGLLCAVGGNGDDGTQQLATSSDGMAWAQRTNPINGSWLRSVAWSPELGLFCIVGRDGSYLGGVNTGFILTSPDGIIWTQRSHPDSTKRLHNVDWSSKHGLFMAVGNDGYAILSSDGYGWVRETMTQPVHLLGNCYSSTLDMWAAVGVLSGSQAYITRTLMLTPSVSGNRRQRWWGGPFDFGGW